MNKTLKYNFKYYENNSYLFICICINNLIFYLSLSLILHKYIIINTMLLHLVIYIIKKYGNFFLISFFYSILIFIIQTYHSLHDPFNKSFFEACRDAENLGKKRMDEVLNRKNLVLSTHHFDPVEIDKNLWLRNLEIVLYVVVTSFFLALIFFDVIHGFRVFNAMQRNAVPNEHDPMFRSQILLLSAFRDPENVFNNNREYGIFMHCFAVALFVKVVSIYRHFFDPH